MIRMMKKEKKNTTEKKERKEFLFKNVIKEWNNLSIVKKMGCMVLLMVCWMLIVDDWLGIDDIIDAIW